ncbi:hypothetical protein CLG85_001515 [Yangia mangrovi]|uniref:Uncharacterized protein n=1 Tax=Alloyangia mangrovi TaxID=1779329 RepID=A0A2A3K329_9RHOB|nr:hypothetical protein [Alloyangia mangrovi]MCT4369087.1 hypothetical protein [Alloyangia mangrovi]
MQVYRGPAIRALYKQLVADFGGVEAAAHLIGCEKGTISKQMNGHAAIGAEHYGALEDEVGRWPITELMFARRERSSQEVERDALIMSAMRELADVGPALLALAAKGDAAAIMKEGPEALEVLNRLVRHVENQE